MNMRHDNKSRYSGDSNDAPRIPEYLCRIPDSQESRDAHGIPVSIWKLAMSMMVEAGPGVSTVVRGPEYAGVAPA